jgi:hypothetical protein
MARQALDRSGGQGEYVAQPLFSPGRPASELQGEGATSAPRDSTVPSTQDLTLSWARAGIGFGFLAVVAYAIISAASVPPAVALVLACVFGPSLAVASIGLYRVLRLQARTVSLDLGVASNVAAGVVVTLMLFAQLGLKRWFDSGSFNVPRAVSAADLETAKGIYLGLDVAWDLFLAVGTVLLAWNMRRHVRFGRVFAWAGLGIASALLVLNLVVFPEPPGDAGLIDLGPLVGLWYLAGAVRMLTSLPWIRDRSLGTIAGQPSVRPST